MESREFLKALADFETTKNISSEIVLEALKTALINAFQRERNCKEAQVRVDIDAKKGTIDMFHQRVVVENVKSPDLEVSLAAVQEINSDMKLGDIYEVPVDVDHFNRMAALRVKQVLRQKIRESEKQMIYDAYIGLKDDIITGVIERVEKSYVLINIGRTNALMRANQMIPNEKYMQGATIKAYITDVDRESQGAQVLVSRADPNFLKRLFENEITEIYDGTVEIRAIARDPGERSKVAVSTRDPNVDPTGACIGVKGMRIQKISNQLAGEKIDVIQYYEEPELYIAEALKPATVYGLALDRNSHAAVVVVPNEELSLSIGKKGQNARLAYKLTTWKIDIKTVDDAMKDHIIYRTLADIRNDYAKLNEEVSDESGVQPLVEPTEIKSTGETEVTIPVVEAATPIVEAVKEVKPVEVVPKAPVVEEKPYVSTETFDVPQMPYVSVVEESKTVETPVVARPVIKKVKPKKTEEDKPTFKMPVYTEAELKELEESEAKEADNKSKYDEDIDYDEYDKYYDN